MDVTVNRADRRNRWDLAKARAVRVWMRWHRPRPMDTMPAKSYSSTHGTVYMTPKDIASGIAHLAETHCRPCSCWMCDVHKHEKKSLKQRVADLVAREMLIEAESRED